MEFEGTLVRDLPEEGGTSAAGNVWRKKTWVFEVPSGQYTNNVAVTVMGDRINSFHFEMGKRYAVSFDINSREYNGKWYTDIKAYSYRDLDAPQGQIPPAPQPQLGNPVPPAAPASDPFAGGSNSTDDLPF